MQATVKDISRILEAQYPLHLAEKWDNVGLQIGSCQNLVHKVMVSLDLDREILSQAIEQQVDMIITHHPLFFNAIKKIDYEQAQGDLIARIIKNNINVYAAHTNLDAASSGLNQYLAEKLGLLDIQLLEQGQAYSLGRIGKLAATVSLQEFCAHVKDRLQLDRLRVVGKWPDKVQKIAVVSGAGASFIPVAQAHNCDLLLTGDLKYHEAKEAEALGMAVIDAGHQGTEQIMATLVADFLRGECRRMEFDIDIGSAFGDDCIKTI